MGRLSLLALLGLFSLMGCRLHSDDDDDDHHRLPEIDGFHVVDSYGYSTEDSDEPMILNPYLDNGEFEVYWYADNMADYTVDLRINDRPVYSGSRLINVDYCGPGLDCDREGTQFCQYYSDFSMSCDAPGASDPGQRITYFDDWVDELPERLYLILDLCDSQTSYCEYEVRRIYVE